MLLENWVRQIFQWKIEIKRVKMVHTIDEFLCGGGGARCGGNGGAILFVLAVGLRSFASVKLFALPLFVDGIWKWNFFKRFSLISHHKFRILKFKNFIWIKIQYRIRTVWFISVDTLLADPPYVVAAVFETLFKFGDIDGTLSGSVDRFEFDLLRIGWGGGLLQLGWIRFSGGAVRGACWVNNILLIL